MFKRNRDWRDILREVEEEKRLNRKLNNENDSNEEEINNEN
ncbi:hypothetical protein [Mycoplasma parvum]|uniref:Uncharacterized protein n=1 Tax=Mycoplasma parvum str. Indiana TaxID=1403316 RepID=U5NCJ7_9MOLU|nr:hypothetical protein [Mycoplasma parvum]AGX89152.1 hypothetical protein PRV_02070 [Mycoplasma parvum str. Indiana]